MNVQNYIKEKKNVYEELLLFIDNDESDQKNISNLMTFLKAQNVEKDHNEFKLFFHLINKLVKNHRRDSQFFRKIEEIFTELKDNMKQSFSNTELFTIFSDNKRLLLFLFENNMITVDERIFKRILKKSKPVKSENVNDLIRNKSYEYYFYPEIKNFYKEEERQKIENEFEKIFGDFDMKKFEEKRKNGENDSYICQLIRNDLIQDFVAYVNRTNYQLSSHISQSIFETNSFLIKRNPTLIEYAFFYGSIQIIQYLQLNKIRLDSSIWFYSIHSNNAEIIDILVEKKISPPDLDYRRCVKESIKCHHNEIAQYIYNEFINEQTKIDDEENNYNENILSFNNQEIIDLLLSQKGVRIGFRCFAECKSLTKITIPQTITSIGRFAFFECSSLEQIIIPSSVTKIGESSFHGCTSLEQITIPPSITEISKFAFCYCTSLTQIEIPTSVTEIEKFAFNQCTSLEQIMIPSTVTEIRQYAFSGCSSLKEIEIPSSLPLIEIGTFSFCSSLTQITIPSSVTSICDYAFRFCSSLTQISIPSSVTYIEQFAFCGCSSLTQVIFENHSSVSEIGNNAFDKCKSLKEINIPISVTKIGEYAFLDCSSLEKIKVPKSVVSIGYGAFFNCVSAKDVLFPPNIDIHKIGFKHRF